MRHVMLVAESRETDLTARGMLLLVGNLVRGVRRVFLGIHLQVLGKSSALFDVAREFVYGRLVELDEALALFILFA